MNLNTGHLLAGGRYRVERVLGQGGFGITYEARDTKFKSRVKSVAIKEFFVKDFCNREQETNRIVVATQSKVELVEKLRNKFIDEANALFELEHPGIVRVTDTFEENGTAYYVMEYINGSSLSTIIETDGPLNENKALGYIRQAASALEYLHGQNRLHLDIKPQNIMVDNDGRVVLIDFGISKQYDKVNGENTSTLLGSTPGYAPIEQSGRGVSEFYPSTDIYSLGATLYKLLTGNTPLPAHQLASGETLPPLPHSVSATTRKAVECAISLNRNNRPQNIGEFLSLLECYSEQKNSSSTLGGEESRSDGGEENRNTDNGATVVGENVAEKKILRPAQNDSARADNTPKRSFSNGTILILSVASVLLFVALFFIKSCNDSNTAEPEAQQATAIAESETIDCSRGTPLEPQTAAVDMPSHGTIDGYEYVDLGLPSGLLWATCNVGASKPEETGGYYAWGETEEKKNYDWSTYKWCKGSENTMTKYCTDSDYGKVDNKTVLDPEDDVAHVKWGGRWRMPTKDEQEELIYDCTWTWTTQNGVKGYSVTGPNGNSIFLPAAGNRDDEFINCVGWNCCYWNTVLDEDDTEYANRLWYSDMHTEVRACIRFYGFPVRPVCTVAGANKEVEQQRKETVELHGVINDYEYVDLGLSVKWATCNVGASKPEETGGYYAWGETEEKKNYDWSTYKWCKGSENTMTKYCTDSDYGKVDNKTVLDPEDDVAHVKWGSTWRMPTKTEQNELRGRCKWEWVTINGVKGYKVTSKKNGNSIFLPAAGYRYKTEVNYRGSDGFYWASSLLGIYSRAYHLGFNSDWRDWRNSDRCAGFPVRPVSE